MFFLALEANIRIIILCCRFQFRYLLQNPTPIKCTKSSKKEIQDGIFRMNRRGMNVIEFALSMMLPKHVIIHLLLSNIHQWERYNSMNHLCTIYTFALNTNRDTYIVTLTSFIIKRLATVVLEVIQRL